MSIAMRRINKLRMTNQLVQTMLTGPMDKTRVEDQDARCKILFLAWISDSTQRVPTAHGVLTWGGRLVKMQVGASASAISLGSSYHRHGFFLQSSLTFGVFRGQSRKTINATRDIYILAAFIHVERALELPTGET